MSETGWVIEHPESSPAAPRYLSYEGYVNGMMVFVWREEHIHALRFSRKEDAQFVAQICRTHQPDLWERRVQFAPARIAEHAWS